MSEHITITAVMIAGAGLAVWLSHYKPSTQITVRQAQDACAASIRAGLHNPRSVEWVSRNTWHQSRDTDGAVTVTATYRATNGFGAMVMNTVQCELLFDGRQYAFQGLRE